jgi:hypothetical protein
MEQELELKKLLKDPEHMIRSLSEYGKSESFAVRRQEIVNGPHLDSDIIFQAALNPSYQISDDSVSHIAMCPVCMEEYILCLQLNKGQELTWPK